jgi:hypothetical protein
MAQKFYNWLLKQWFYFVYLVLKQGSNDMSEYICQCLETITPFYSNSFFDGQWRHDKLEEWKTFPDPTKGIKGFKQQYGKWYFKARLDGLVESDCRPAIWLYDEKSLTDVMKGDAEHPYYYEIDIELFKEHFGYTIWYNTKGGQGGATVVRSLFANRKLYRKLQSEYHLFLIDWTKEWIKMYINGILTCKFKNEIHVPCQIITGRCSMSDVIVKN